MFNNSKLKRAQKRASSATEETRDESPSTRKITRRSPAPFECFLCKKTGQTSELRHAMTQVCTHVQLMYLCEDKFVLLFGGLHIEMAAFSLIGNLLKGSGWTSILTDAGVASSGTAESFLTASSVTRTRQAH